MALFKDTADYASVFPLLKSSSWEMLLPFVELTEAEVMSAQVLGPTLYAALHAAYQSSIATTPVVVPAPLDALLPKVRKVLAFLATYDAMEVLNVQYSAAGMTITTTANQQPAPMWRVNKSRAQMLKQAYGHLNQLIMHLTAHEDLLTDWAEAPVRTEIRESLIPDMRACERHLRLAGPWLLYQLRPALRRVQEGPVQKLIGASAYTTLLGHVHADPSTITTTEAAWLDHIRPAMLHTAIAEQAAALQLNIDAQGIWTWTMASGGGGNTSGGENPVANDRLTGLVRHHKNLGDQHLEALRLLLEPDTNNAQFPAGETGSVFFGGA